MSVATDLKKNKYLFRLRSILLLAMLTVLMLPLGSLYLFSLYENELVRQTELELIAQSAAFSAMFVERVNEQHKGSPYGLKLSKKRQKNRSKSNDYYTPVEATLDLSDEIVLPRRKFPKRPEIISDDLAQKIGTEFKNILINTQRVTLSGMRILDYRGVVISGKSEIGWSLAHVPEIQQALSGRYNSVIRERISDEATPPLTSISRGTAIRVFTAYPVIDKDRLYGVIYLSRTPKNLLKHLYENRVKVMWLSGTILLVTLILVLFVASTIARPIRKLIEQTQQVTSGKRDRIAPLKYPVTNEVALLSESFANMANTLSDRSNYIRDFASHVSHEFKTPITSMQGALELLQEHSDSMPADRRERFITNMLEDTERLKRLVTRLLELARVDAMEVVKENSDLLQCLSRLANRYEERGLTLQLPETTVQLSIPGDSLETIFTNLFDNSLQHGANEVKIALFSNDMMANITVIDNGEGISQSNKKRIFTPFFTTRRQEGGTGLGLGIVDSILKTYHGSIELLDSDDDKAGASFRIRLSCSMPH